MGWSVSGMHLTSTFAGKAGTMYIKNERFSDEETLMEMLFDFSLGDPQPMILELQQQIEKDLAANEAYQTYHASLTDEEDRLELETEERLIRLAEALMERFDRFETKQQSLYGWKGNEQTLLYSIDMV